MSALITLGDAVPEESCEIQATEERKQPEAATLAEVREATRVTATGILRKSGVTPAPDASLTR